MNDQIGYDKLELIEKPNSPRNVKEFPMTLSGCKGYLEKFKLTPPNVDSKTPQTVADMTNILTDPDAAAQFSHLQLQEDSNGQSSSRKEGRPSPIYDYRNNQMKAMLNAAQKRACHAKSGMLGHIVDPGCLSFYKLDGKTYAAPPGRWLLTNVKAHWISKNVSLDSNVIKPPSSQVLIVRVPPGCVGRIKDQGVEELLDVGMHVFNSGTVTVESTVEYSRVSNFSHGGYHYVRVPRGNYARVWAEVPGPTGRTSVQPRILQEGEHFVHSFLFKHEGYSKVSEAYIQHGSIHLISVQKGYVAKVVQDNIPRLLAEGDHRIESSSFEYNGMVNVNLNNCIAHGTITVLRVTEGEIALCWANNEPSFLSKPGLYEFNSADFSFVAFKNAEEQFIQLGSKKIILVQTGQVGVTYDNGELKILKSGRHVIDSATHIFTRLLSTQQKSIRLASYSTHEKDARKQSKTSGSHHKPPSTQLSGPHSDLTVCETKDLVKVGMRADVFYSIEDPEKCIQKIDTDELEDLVRETAVATLTNIIRSTALNQIAQSKQVSTRKSDNSLQVLAPPVQQDQAASQAAIFFEKVHDEFLSTLNEDFMERYGVDIANIRIESFKIMDEELADQISQQALTTAQIENEMANLEGKSLISTTQETTKAQVRNINAKADAEAKKTAADAENQRNVDAALAEAEALKIKTRAEAEAAAESILTKAKAEAEAIRLKAAAEAERAEVLSRTVLGQQEALLRLYSNMVIESNRGVEKVVYLDPSVNRESPFALGSLQNLNFDLHSLSQMGIAAHESKNGKRN